MEIFVDENEKIMEIWLSRSDIQILSQETEQKIAEYRKRKYRIAIFRSGNCDLKTQVERLLVENVRK